MDFIYNIEIAKKTTSFPHEIRRIFVFLKENNFLSFEKANGKQFETIVSFGVQNDVATSLLMWRHIRMKFSDVAT